MMVRLDVRSIIYRQGKFRKMISHHKFALSGIRMGRAYPESR